NPEEVFVMATFELPDLSKDKVNIGVHNGNLTVSGGVSESSKKEEPLYVIQERRPGRFSRSIKLLDGTDPKEVNLSIEDGVLAVTFPRSSPGIGPQGIAIN
ncbi:small heat shock protein, partial [Thelephora ganbajun]